MEEEQTKSSNSLVVGIVAILILAVGGYFLFTRIIDKPEEDKEMDTLTLQLKWIEQAQFMGFLVADELG
jgi:hypothetical protein